MNTKDLFTHVEFFHLGIVAAMGELLASGNRAAAEHLRKVCKKSALIKVANKYMQLESTEQTSMNALMGQLKVATKPTRKKKRVR